MSIEIKTATTEPLRTTFDHLRDRLGEGKTPSRYQEAVFDLQATLNFHYRPTWAPDSALYDPGLTAIRMDDWDQLTDPRQYYYATYVMARGRQQDSQDKNFSLVEDKKLLAGLDADGRERLTELTVPLRHAEWGANQVNVYIAGYGSGAAMTSAATFQAFDRLGNAQYLSRLGLLLGDGAPDALGAAKSAWLAAPHWQPLRRLLEDLLVEKDWFEAHLVQNFLLDGLLHPTIFEDFSDALAPRGGLAFPLLTEFTVAWFSESVRWTDAVLKRAAAESEDNARQFTSWAANWTPRIREAVAPLAELALGEAGEACLEENLGALKKRAEKCGIEVS